MDRCQIVAALQLYGQPGPAVYQQSLIGLIYIFAVQMVAGYLYGYGRTYLDAVTGTVQVITPPSGSGIDTEDSPVWCYSGRGYAQFITIRVVLGTQTVHTAVFNPLTRCIVHPAGSHPVLQLLLAV